MSNIDSQKMVNNLYSAHDNLQNKAQNAGYVGGIQIAGFGIPNQFLGLDLRTDAQRDAQAAPGQFMESMQAFLRTLNEALTAAAQVNRG
ncbi:MAG: hypothetical protein VKS61_16965 [Candidatus Sericytochromatia bacterium]|nr:hypothetical protein [Candidatus Sericytochromatia bacterium]